MRKLHSILSKKASRFLYLALFVLGLNQVNSQTTIVIEPGSISYTNIDDTEPTIPVVDSYTNIDVSNCSSIQIEVEFEFSEPWPGGGGDSMESVDECQSGPDPCNGDPNDPLQGSCSNCWDFMWIQLFIGGSEEEDFLLGVDGSTPQDGTYTSMVHCTDGETDADIIITNQNWAAHETNTFSNISLICWEGIPSITTNAPVCEGGTIDLDGDAIDPSVIDTWSWTNSGNGNIADPDIQNTSATDVEDGETYTLTVTDSNNCDATVDEVLSLTPSFDATLLGGGVICEEGCTDFSSHIEVALSGGVEPYTVEFSVNGITIPFPFAFDIDENIFQICHEGGGFLPSWDTDADPVQITIPELFWDISIEIESITDDNGCPGTITGGDIDLEAIPSPDVSEPDLDPVCMDGTTGFDLTQYDDEILDGGPGDVIYLEDPDDSNSEISNPTSYDLFNNNPVWAVVFDDPCYSAVIELDFDVNVRPEILIQNPNISFCGEELAFPDFSEVVLINNQDSPAYYLDPTQTDGPYGPGDIATVPIGTGSFYVYDSSTPGCDAQVEISYTAFQEPEIVSPLGTLSACGLIELPEPEVNNEVDMTYNYNTSPDGTGDEYFEGDELEASSGITLLYLIVQNDEGVIPCQDTAHITLEYLGGTSFTADIPSRVCDTLFLPPIVPASATAGYFTSTTGGIRYEGGDTITHFQANLSSNVLDTLYLYDTTQTGACATIDTLVFEIGRTPILAVPFLPQFCESGILPPPSNNNPNLQYASDNTFTNILNPATPITESTPVFYRDSVPYVMGGGACYAQDSFFLEIIEAPNPGQDSTYNICEGYIELVNLFGALGDADTDGEFSIDGNPVDFEIADSTMVDLSVLPVGTQEIYYTIEKVGCPPAIATITINVTAQPALGITTDLSVCETSGTIELDQQVMGNDNVVRWIIEDPSGNVIYAEASPSWTYNNINPGSYTVSYQLETQVGVTCQDLEGFFTINILDAINAGTNGDITICKGQTIDINTLLSADANPGGTFFQDGFEVFDPLNWLPASLNDQILVSYVLETSSPSCVSDTAFINVNLSDNLSAGLPAMDSIACIGTEINLTDYLDDETPGGDFYLATDLTSPIPATYTVTTPTAFTYIIPGAQGCTPDTTNFMLGTAPTAMPTLSLSQAAICFGDGDCLTLDVQSNVDGELNILVQSDEAGTAPAFITVATNNGQGSYTLCPSDQWNETSTALDTFFVGHGPVIDISVVDISNTAVDCQLGPVAATPVVLDIFEDFELTIDTTICTGATIMFQNENYSSSTTIMETRANGCDSIVIINIDNYVLVPNDLDRALCDGQSYTEIPGYTFTNSIDTTIILVDGSAFGCDSTINLSLAFSAEAVGDLDLELCFGESMMVDGVLIDATTVEEVPFPAGSVFGCDSSTVVTAIVFDEVIPGNFSNTICPEDNFPLGDQVFDINNQMGIATLTGDAVGGCDSTVNVMLSFFPETYDYPLELCPNESIIIGDDIYDANGSSSISSTNELSINGCDSIVNVILTVRQDSETTLDINLCMDMDTIINGTTYNATNNMGSSVLENVFGCDSTVIVSVELAAPAVDYFIDSCPGDEEAIITITDVQGLNLPLDLMIDGQAAIVIDNLPFDVGPLPVGPSYSLTFDDGNCELTEAITVDDATAPALELLSTMLTGTSFELSVAGDATITSYAWTPSAFLDCTDCPMPIATVTDPTTIEVVVTTQNDCSYPLTITLDPEEVIDTTIKVYIPNSIALSEPFDQAFTIFSNIDNLNIEELSIYDRWGNVVYSQQNFPANNTSFAWDGRLNGTEVEQGVYVYVVRYTDPQFGAVVEHGNLTVIR